MNISSEIEPSAGSTVAPANQLVRRLARRYLLVLALVAGLIVTDQAVIQPLLVRLSSFAPVINLSGRQRMLSQKLAKAALALEFASDVATRQSRRAELGATLTEWSAAHEKLSAVDNVVSAAKLDSAELANAWANMQPHFDAMCVAAADLAAPSAPAGPEAASVAAIVDHESAFLVKMDHIVGLLEAAAEKQVARLRMVALSIAVGVIGLLVGLGWLVVRPAALTIRDQVDNLEQRVAQRTDELSGANRALQIEVVERQQAEEKTQRLALQLAHTARVSAMGHLAPGLAHELNHPLAAIANFADACELLLAQPGHDDQQVVNHFEQIRLAALRAGHVVRRMRNFVRPSGGLHSAVDLNLLVGEVAELCRFESERAEVQVTIEPAPAPLKVDVDAIQIQQVLVNLIHNAVEAMLDCPPEQRRLELKVRQIGEQARVDVVDSGAGLSGVDLDAMFTPFCTTKADGLGIGLSICRSIIEQHGGSIWAGSTPSCGATLSFVLPLIHAHDAADREQDNCICR